MPDIKVDNLTCEYKVNPLGIGEKNPLLSWQLAAVEERNSIFQTAYEIQVSSDNQFAEIIWDTGRVSDGDSCHHEYAGPELQSGKRYYWRVKSWDQDEQSGDWSKAAWWETGLLDAKDWQACWIGLEQDKTSGQPSPYLRYEWECSKELKQARLYAAARGLYAAEINAMPVDDTYFAPGWTVYDKRIQYQAYDVTKLISQGRNVLGVILAEGWYKGKFGFKSREAIYGDQLAFFGQLELEYADGSRQVISSDENWLATTGPIVYSSIYMGEIYDARREMPGWSSPEYRLNKNRWQPVSVFDFANENLIAQENQPVRVIEELKPLGLIDTPGGDRIIDMGQNMVGWIRLRVKGKPDTRIVIDHAEVLDKDGEFYTANLRTARQRNEFILNDEKERYLCPRFTWQGFRYIRITGYPGDISLESVTGLVLHSDMPVTGEFSCSDESVNQLQHNILWSQKGNFLDIPTDCPQRDERLGWTGDAQVFIRTACFNMNVASFFQKWLRDLKAEQSLEKGVPFVVPNILDESQFSSAAWGDAAVICPWTLYITYGSRRFLLEHFASMKLWIEYIRRQGDSEFLWNTGFHFGDWLGLDARDGSYVGATAEDLIATAFYAASTSLVIKTAEITGDMEDAVKYRRLYQKIVENFQNEFITGTGRLAVPTQTAHVLVLMFDLAPQEHRQRIIDDLVKLIEENDRSLTTGFVGTPYLCHVLSLNGHHELACQLVMRHEYPSWLYQVDKGATTIWEHWDGIKPDGTFWSENMNSYNHYAYGAVGDWLYRIACGLDTSNDFPGYRRSVIKPMPVPGWNWAKAKLETPYGALASEWSRENGKWQIRIVVPANTSAEIIINPEFFQGFAAEKAVLNERPLAEFCGLAENKADSDWEIYNGILKLRTGSGKYVIECLIPNKN